MTRRAVRAVATLLAVVTVEALTAGCTRAETKERTMGAYGAGRVEVVGRFRLTVPAMFDRRGEAFAFGKVDLGEAALPDGEKAFAAAWAARVAAIAALREPGAEAGDLTGKLIERRTLGPRFEAALYHHDDRADAGKLAGLLAREGRALSLDLFLSLALKDEGVRRFQVIAGAWRPRRAGEPWPVPAKPAFYLGSSVIELGPSGGEKAYVRLETDDARTKLSIETQTTREPDEKGLLARLGDAAMRAGMSLAGGMSIVRSQRVMVGGLKGEELIVKVESGTELAFAWHYPGTEDDSARPEITIKLETDGDRQDEKVAMWDAILRSVKPVTEP